MTAERNRDLESQKALQLVMRGREERYLVQRLLLETAQAVVQITVNVPGWPKRISGDESAVMAAEDIICRKIVPLARVSLDNAAGLCLLISCGLLPEEAKSAAIEIEEKMPWGRAMDVDIITHSGALSRASLGFAPRPCLLCRGDAKSCARSGKHSFRELRNETRILLGRLSAVGILPVVPGIQKFDVEEIALPYTKRNESENSAGDEPQSRDDGASFAEEISSGSCQKIGVANDGADGAK